MNNENLRPQNGKRFSKDYQPTKRRRSIKEVIHELLDDCEGNYIVPQGKFEVLSDGTCKIMLSQTHSLIMILLDLAEQGNIKAIEMLLDRRDGKPAQSVVLDASELGPNFLKDSIANKNGT